MAETSRNYIRLEFNCGFARCAVCTLTTKDRNTATDKQQRMTGFQDLFKDCPNYGIRPSYFEVKSTGISTFNCHCAEIIEGWNRKWHPSENRKQYESTFSVANWKALPLPKKQKHTLTCCQECCNEQQGLQQSFLLKPCYFDKPLVSVNVQKLEKLRKRKGTRNALADLNGSFNNAFERSFVDSLITHGGERLQVISLSLSLQAHTHTHTFSTSLPHWLSIPLSDHCGSYTSTYMYMCIHVCLQYR